MPYTNVKIITSIAFNKRPKNTLTHPSGGAIDALTVGAERVFSRRLVTAVDVLRRRVTVATRILEAVAHTKVASLASLTGRVV